MAVFAGRGWHGRVALDPDRLRPSSRGLAQALDTSSRAGSLKSFGPEASAAAARHLRTADVPFLKIDSLLRGHVAADVAELAATGGWQRVVLAPAFPDRGRTCIDATVRVDGTVVEQQPMLASLDRAGLAPQHVPLSALRAEPHVCERAGVLVVDAETNDDLCRLARAKTSLSTLWVGSAGLATALADGHAGTAAPPVARAARVLTLVGSRTELARRQVGEALRLDPALVHVELDAAGLRGSGPVALPAGERLVVSIADGDGAEDESLVRRLAELVSHHDEALDAFVIVGGATARATLAALGMRELTVVGELEPGVAVCTDARSRPVITKSGSFGDDGTLHRIHGSLHA